ncbi:MAG: class I SAM-dependent methyltransferase [Chloroflexota bacterium]
MSDIKHDVRQFYDQVGWQLVGEDVYQNARYEDLRPVAREYIHKCHLRLARHIQPQGRFFLDAGSGPVQYPEYLEYSRGYQYRLCADISITALQEARKRVGAQGLFVVADIANLPFAPESFDGAVSLHTIHHLPEEEHLRAYQEIYRVLAPGGSAVTVNSWAKSRLLALFEPLVRTANRLRHRLERGQPAQQSQDSTSENPEPVDQDLARATPLTRSRDAEGPKGTFTSRHNVAWMKNEVGACMPVEIRVWRSVSVRFLRALIHPKLGGRAWLRLLYWLEERFPHFFGEQGKYPLVIIRKPREEA